MRKQCLLLLVFLRLFCPAVSGQQYSIEHITTKEGLAQNNVNCMLQDSKGFIWFGTNDGLNRYDGLKFETFRVDLENDEVGLNSNLISKLREDANNDIWIATTDNGVNLYDHSKETIIKITGGDSGVPNDEFFDIKHFGDETWLFSSTKIYIFDSNRKHKLLGGKPFLYFNGNTLRSMAQLNDKVVIVATTSGLFKCQKVGKSDYKVSLLEGTDENNSAALIHFKGGLLAANNSNVHYINQKLEINLISGYGASSMLLNSKGELWYAGSYGLYKYPPHVIDQPYFFKSNEIQLGNFSKKPLNWNKSFLFEDKSKAIWIGMPGSGVLRVTNYENEFGHHFHDLNSGNLLKHGITAALEDSKRNVWIGTDGGGISILPANKTNDLGAFKDLDKDKYSWRSISSFHEVNINGNRQVLVGTSWPLSHKAYVLNNKNELREISLPGALSELQEHITSFASDSTYIWVSTYLGGLYRYNFMTNKLDNFRTGREGSISSNVLRSLLIDTKKRLWIGTDNGLNLLSPAEQKASRPIFKVFKKEKNNHSSISHNYVLPMIETSDGTVWVGTLGGGMNYYDETNGNFKRINTKHGLPNNSILAIVQDEQDDLWVSTNQGLSRVALPELVITNYTLNGQDNAFGELTVTKRANGSVLFGGTGGINIFNPKNITVNNEMPNLVFTKLQILNQTIRAGQKFNDRVVLDKNLDETLKIKLLYKENSFSIYFSAIDFNAAEKIKYRYKLEGLEEHWTETSSESRFAKYTSLLPGTYKLKLFNSNASGLWSERPRELIIIIKRPWWLSNLALLIYTILAVLLVLFFMQFSIIRNKRKYALELERMGRERVEELTQFKLDLFTSISHEFRTPLTIIVGYLDKILNGRKKAEDHQKDKYVEVIQRNTNVLLRLTRQLSDFRKYEDGKLELAVTENNIISFTKQIYESFINIADDKDITYSFESPIANLDLWFDTEKIEKVIYNLISNALKFTQAKGAVTISCEEVNDKCVINVIDNGIGIEKEHQPHVFELYFRANKFKNMGTGIGLSFSKRMIDLHKGDLRLNSEINVGTTFSITLLKGKDHFSEDDFSKVKTSDDLYNLTKSIEWTTPHVLATSIETANSQVGVKDKPLVLVVEDNPEMRNLLSDSLKSTYRIEEVSNGKEGLVKAEEINPDLIISDIVMPEVNGKQLCETLKKDIMTSHIPIILLTAQSSEKQEISGLKVGADDYITKPFRVPLLLARIQNLIASRKVLKENFARGLFLEPKEMSLSTYDEELLTKILTFIDNNLKSEQLGVDHICQGIGLSRRQLYRKAEGLTGMSPKELIKNARLKKVSALLNSGEDRIAEIMYEAGFHNRTTFNRTFKKHFGVSPTEYISSSRSKK